MSSLTWLAHSEAERKRTIDVIRLLGEPGTLDEIGIGGIRDAFAELLFPGTSTIQTRARYFLFVPWIYRDLERRAPIERAAARARREEARLIEALVASGDTQGVIGKEAGARLQRLPSAIYWQGLERWGLRRSRLPLRSYHRRLEGPAFRRESEEAGDGEGVSSSLWHPELPDPPDGFPRGATPELTAEEAEFLRAMVTTHCPDTLLATLALEAERAPIRVEAPWALDAALLAGASPRIREQLDHARAFSELILGAQLLYNLMLAEASEREELREEYRRRIELWAAQVSGRRAELEDWKRQRTRFWEIVGEGNPRVRPRAAAFAEEWFGIVLSADPAAVAAEPRARRLIAERERALKGPLARLENASALEAWNGASGSEQLVFRWRRAQMLLDDIGAPLAS